MSTLNEYLASLGDAATLNGRLMNAGGDISMAAGALWNLGSAGGGTLPYDEVASGIISNISLAQLAEIYSLLGTPTAEFVPYIGVKDAGGNAADIDEEVATWDSTNGSHTFTFTSGNRPSLKNDSNLNSYIDFTGGKYGTNATIAAAFDDTGKSAGDVGKPHTYLFVLSLPDVTDVHIGGLTNTSYDKVQWFTSANGELTVKYFDNGYSQYSQTGSEAGNNAKVVPTADSLFIFFVTFNGEKAYCGYAAANGEPIIFGQLDGEFSAARTFDDILLGASIDNSVIEKASSPKIYQMVFWDDFIYKPRNLLLSVGSNYQLNNGSPTSESNLVPTPTQAYHFSPSITSHIDFIGETVKIIESGTWTNTQAGDMNPTLSGTGFDFDYPVFPALVTDSLTLASANVPSAVHTHSAISSWTIALKVYMPAVVTTDTVIIDCWDGVSQHWQIKWDYTSGSPATYQIEFRLQTSTGYSNWKTGLNPAPSEWNLIIFGYDATAGNQFCALNDGAVATNAYGGGATGQAVSDIVLGDFGTGAALCGFHWVAIWDSALTQGQISALKNLRSFPASPSVMTPVFEKL